MIPRTMPAPEPTTLPLANALERLAQQPDPDAWAAVVNGCGVSLHRQACRLTGDPALADDVVQEVLLIIRDRADQFQVQSADPDGDARRWITRIGINVALKLVRGQQRLALRERHHAQQQADNARQDGVEAPLVHREHAALLRQALAELPEAVRTAIVLHHVSGAGLREIAKQFDCPIGTVKARVSRGLRILHQLLLKEGVVLSTGAIALALPRLPVPAADPTMLLHGCHQLLHAKLTASIAGLPAAAAPGMGVAAKAGVACVVIGMAAFAVLGAWLLLRPTPTVVRPEVVAAAVAQQQPLPPLAHPPMAPETVAPVTAAPFAVLTPPAYAVLLISHPGRLLDAVVAADPTGLAFSAGNSPRHQLGELLNDPALAGLEDRPVLAVISTGTDQPSTAFIVSCGDPEHYVDAVVAHGLVGQVSGSLAILADTASGLSAALPSAAHYQELSAQAPASGVELSCSPRQLTADFGPRISALLEQAAIGNSSQSLVRFGYQVLSAICTDVDRLTITAALHGEDLELGWTVQAQPGSALAAALVAPQPARSPSAASHLGQRSYACAMSGRYAAQALNDYALNLIVTSGAGVLPQALVNPQLLPQLHASSQHLTGDFAVRLSPSADGGLAIEQVTGTTDAAATYAANRSLLDAQAKQGLDFFGITAHRHRQAVEREGQHLDRWTYDLAEGLAAADPRAVALTHLLRPAVTTSASNFVFCGTDAASVLAMVHAPAHPGDPGMTTHAQAILAAGADGYWDLDLLAVDHWLMGVLQPLLLGGAAPSPTAPAASDPSTFVGGSWTIADGTCHLDLHIPAVLGLYQQLSSTMLTAPSSRLLRPEAAPAHPLSKTLTKLF